MITSCMGINIGWKKKMKLKTENGYEFEIDEQDLELVSQYIWHGRKEKRKLVNGETREYNSYIQTNIINNGKRSVLNLHNLLVNPPKGKQTDHIDRNGLNNKRSNLRVCTHSQNQMNKKVNNSSGLKGVRLHKGNGKWEARIKLDGKPIHIGYFVSKEDAALAYDAMAITHFGEFARPNILTMPGVPK